MKVIYDTGSSWLWVQTTACKLEGSDVSICLPKSEMYNETDSAFYKEFPNTQENTVNLTYGIGEAKGKLVKDRVCLDEEATLCDDDYDLLAVYRTSSLSNLRTSGIVGMAPANNY